MVDGLMLAKLYANKEIKLSMHSPKFGNSISQFPFSVVTARATSKLRPLPTPPFCGSLLFGLPFFELLVMGRGASGSVLIFFILLSVPFGADNEQSLNYTYSMNSKHINVQN